MEGINEVAVRREPHPYRRPVHHITRKDRPSRDDAARGVDHEGTRVGRHGTSAGAGRRRQLRQDVAARAIHVDAPVPRIPQQ